MTNKTRTRQDKNKTRQEKIKIKNKTVLSGVGVTTCSEGMCGEERYTNVPSTKDGKCR